MSIIDQINQKLYTKTAKINSVACLSEKHNNTELYQNIIILTNFLPMTASFAERIYCIKNNITYIQLCSITKNHCYGIPSQKCTGGAEAVRELKDNIL